jgi:hypothetical protein
MYRAGIPLEQVQHLLGHTSIKTIEIYIKARLPDLVAPTSRPMVKVQAADGRPQTANRPRDRQKYYRKGSKILPKPKTDRPKGACRLAPLPARVSNYVPSDRCRSSAHSWGSPGAAAGGVRPALSRQRR